MKKIVIVAVSLILVFVLGLTSILGAYLLLNKEDGVTFKNVHRYVTLPDYTDPAFAVSAEELALRVAEQKERLLSSHLCGTPKTEGVVSEGDRVYIYYKGTLVLFDGEVSLKVGSEELKAVSGFEKALKKAKFQNGKARFDLTTPQDFSYPAFLPANGIDNDYRYFAGKKTVVELWVDGKEGTVTDGELLVGQLRWTEPDFSGGSYTEKDEIYKKEPNAQKGYPLIVGSGAMIKGFEEGLLGMEIFENSQKTVKLHFPAPYPANQMLAGLAAEFEVTLLATEHLEKYTLPAEWSSLVSSITKTSRIPNVRFLETLALRYADDYDGFLLELERLEKAQMVLDLLMEGTIKHKEVENSTPVLEKMTVLLKLAKELGFTKLSKLKTEEQNYCKELYNFVFYADEELWNQSFSGVCCDVALYAPKKEEILGIWALLTLTDTVPEQ